MSAIALIRTETGSVYWFDPTEMTLTRVVVGAKANDLRRDGEALKVRGVSELRVGKSAVFTLEPLGEGDVTVRTTSPVVSIVKVVIGS